MKEPANVSDNLADELPLATKLEVARNSAASLREKLRKIALEQDLLGERAARGELIGGDLERLETELKTLRRRTEKGLALMAAHALALEQKKNA